MWKEEDEEKYNDMNIVEKLTRGKRGVMGEFPEILVKEKPMRFKYVKLFDDRLGIYLPEKEGDSPHIGKDFYYPTEMGEYIECVCEDNNYYFTVEYVGDKEEADLNILSDEMCDDINDRYECTKAKKLRQYNYNGLKFIIISTKIYGEEDYYCIIFMFKKDAEVYRVYFLCEFNNYEVLSDMAYKIIENINNK
ncbi:MAG: hypothetical protein IJA34_04255 [Lachnospiraceae bacterium]|nr:hypothetical protein [Lachnospiraceae bacterium]